MLFSRFSPMVLCSDVAASRAFYSSTLDLTVNADLGWFVGMERRSDGVVTFELSLCDASHDSLPPSIRAPATGLVLAFETSGVDAVCAAWREQGVDILLDPVSEPWGQRHFYAAAPDGVAIDVFEPCPPDPQWMRAHGFG